MPKLPLAIPHTRSSHAPICPSIDDFIMMELAKTAMHNSDSESGVQDADVGYGIFTPVSNNAVSGSPGTRTSTLAAVEDNSLLDLAKATMQDADVGNGIFGMCPTTTVSNNAALGNPGPHTSTLAAVDDNSLLDLAKVVMKDADADDGPFGMCPATTISDNAASGNPGTRTSTSVVIEDNFLLDLAKATMKDAGVDNGVLGMPPATTISTTCSLPAATSGVAFDDISEPMQIDNKFHMLALAHSALGKDAGNTELKC
jgi:hypothetical protein